MISPSTPSDEYGELQRLVDDVYRVNPSHAVPRMDILVRAEINDLSDDLMEVVNLLPAGSYKRARLCDQLNSAIGGHAWGQVYGTVE